MPIFHVEVAKTDGSKKIIRLEASDKKEAIKKIRANGLEPLSIAEVKAPPRRS